MGWKDRDYAKWTNEERSRFLNAGGSAPSRAGRGPAVTGGVAAAVAVSAALFVLGHFPGGHPLVPALHFSLPSPSSGAATPSPIGLGLAPRPTVRLTGPKVVPVRSFLTFHGPVPSGDEGTVRILGSLDGRSWRTLAVADGSSGSYLARIGLNQRGSLRLRLMFRDGAEATETVRVR